MKHLLKTTIQRRLSIIGILRDFYDWQDPQLLADLLDCSTKTILSDIEAINHDWQDKIGIEYSRTKGIRLDDSLHNKIRPLAADIMEESESFQFLERVFFRPNEDADYWINELYISEATFYRMVRQIDDVMEKRGLRLERKPFRITADDERWVRIFYVHLFLEKYGLSEWPFDLEKDKIITFVHRSSEAFDIMMNDRDTMEYSFLLSIIIIRCSQGLIMSNSTIKEPDEEILAKLKDLYTYAEATVENSDYVVTKTWYQEVIHSLFYDYFLTNKKETYDQVCTGIESFLEQLVSTFKIPLEELNQKHLTQKMLRIYRGYYIYPYSRAMLFNEAAFFSRSAQHYYPHFARTVQQQLIDLEREMAFPWFSQFYFLVLRCLFTEWGQLAHYLDVLSPKVKILIVSDSGRRHGEMLSELIQSRFYYRVEITVYDESVLHLTPEKMEAFDVYDLVISNYSLKQYPYSNLQIVDDFLTEVDFSIVNSVIKQIR